MAGPKIGGGGTTGGASYVKSDARPHVSTLDAVWPGAYTIARRYTAHSGNGVRRAQLLADLKIRLIECCAERPEVPVEPGYIAEVAHDMIRLSDTDGIRL
jgi:hypothetical protein